MVQLCQKFPCAPEAKALAAEYPKASAFISKLRQENMSADAVQALARWLPKDKAVDWASKSAAMAGEKSGLSPEEQDALTATEAWISNPDEANRLAAASAADNLPASSPAGAAAHAAAFADGVEVPEEAPQLETGDDLTAHFSAGSVMLAAAKMSPEGVPEVSEVPPPAENLSSEDLIAEGAEQLMESPQPLEMTAEQQAETAKYLDPFLDLGIEIAQTVPGWV
jgi:hypothetical protein